MCRAGVCRAVFRLSAPLPGSVSTPGLCGQPACTEPRTQWGHDALVSCPYEWKPNPKQRGKGLSEREGTAWRVMTELGSDWVGGWWDSREAGADEIMYPILAGTVELMMIMCGEHVGR